MNSIMIALKKIWQQVEKVIHDSLIYEIKTEDVYEDLAAIRKCLILVIIQLSQNTIIIQTN